MVIILLIIIVIMAWVLLLIKANKTGGMAMKVIKCEKCGEIFFEADGSVGDHRSFEQYLCAECSDEHEAEVVRYEEMEVTP
jgi:hypothetical protein